MKVNRPIALLVLALASCSSVASDVIFDGSVPGSAAGSTVAPVDRTYVIPQSLGFTNNGNLFQSFQQLNIDAGDTAVFQSSDAIRHILTRVTGGQPTTINGTLRASNPAITAFWLLNQAGLLIGESAVLDVPGAIALGAADSILFPGGAGWASVRNQGTPAILLTADPTSFGFVTGVNAARGVTILGQHFESSGTDRILDGRSWYLSGGEVSITSAGDLTLDGGRIVTLSHPTASGNITVSAQGDLIMNGTIILSDSNTGNKAGDIRVSGRAVTIERGTVVSQARSTGGTGSISVTASSLALRNKGQIVSQNSGSGAGAPIRVAANTVRIEGTDPLAFSTYIRSNAQGTGDAADIDIQANTIELLNRGGIISFSSGGARSSDIALSAATGLYLSGGSIVSEDRSTGSTHQSGSVDVTIGRSGTLQLINESEISAVSVAGTGGDVTINIDSGAIELDNSIFKSTTVSGIIGGNIKINAGGSSLGLVDSAIVTAGLDNGNGGNITIEDAGRIVLRNSEIGAQSGVGDGGNITINSAPGAVLIQDYRSLITAEAQLGVNGKVSINSPNTDLNSAVQPQDVDVSRPAALASNVCAPAGGEIRSTLIREGKGGVTESADGYLTAGVNQQANPENPQRLLTASVSSVTDDSGSKCF